MTPWNELTEVQKLHRQLANALFRKLKFERTLFQVMQERDELRAKLDALTYIELLPDVPQLNPLTLEEFS